MWNWGSGDGNCTDVINPQQRLGRGREERGGGEGEGNREGGEGE